ncbi:tRNA preQ1(34) S-adenosylmethionine ribosyltransferase-isomerase QueA [Candidatus Saccharibacteria bacterium]|nr:tRNA preQ1(34) S-adenosylmethionine ribosyltransferase-isomerase QueA [Candidatus Saccharibacteria bacterium]
MLVSEYNYNLPEERIAKFPPQKRGSTRLLVLDRITGSIKDSQYQDLADFLNPGDVLILNDTRVMQSRLFCKLPDGRKRELIVLEKHGNEPQRVMYRGKLHEGDKLKLCDKISGDIAFEEHNRRRGDYGATEPRNDGREGAFRKSNMPDILVKHVLGNGIAEVESSLPLSSLAEKYGTVPLPPYLHRDATENDKKRYQTVWAKHMGSAAAPTASLNMTDELLERLRQKGVIIKYLTLHVGLGTFLPMRTDQVEDHQMHSEWFNIPEDTIESIKAARKALSRERSENDAFLPPKPRIIALGTTVARTLEYYAKTGKTSGEDDIFIYPGFEFKLVDALITNFHAPKSTVLMLAAAFAGWGHLKSAYDHAIAERYNFLSYGDSMLIC